MRAQAFPPGQFRHIHIGFLVQRLADAVAASGLDFRGDAAAMANTIGETWERHYLKGTAYYNTMASAAVDRMVKWRQGVVASLDAAAARPTSEEGGGAGAAAAAPGPSGAAAPPPQARGMPVADLWRKAAAARRQHHREAAATAAGERSGLRDADQPVLPPSPAPSPTPEPEPTPSAAVAAAVPTTGSESASGALDLCHSTSEVMSSADEGGYVTCDEHWSP